MSSAAPPAAPPPPPPPPRGESPAEVVLAQPELRSLIVARLIACCTPAELARAECTCKTLHDALTPHWRACCAALSPGVVHLRARLVDAHTDVPLPARWRRLHQQLVSAEATEASARAETWACEDVMFSAEVRHRGALVFVCTFGAFKAEGHVGDAFQGCSHCLESSCRTGVVHFAAGGGDDDVKRRPRLTAGDLLSPENFTAELHGVHLKRGSAVACLCAGVTADVGAAYGLSQQPEERAQAPLVFYAQLPSICRESVDDGRAPPIVELQLWFQARDATEDATDSDEEEVVAADDDDEEKEEEDASGSSSSDGECDELIMFQHSPPPADTDEGQRARARRVIVRPAWSAKYEPSPPATLNCRFADEDDKCTCEQLSAALDLLHWAA
jgi:hypothetical protein